MAETGPDSDPNAPDTDDPDTDDPEVDRDDPSGRLGRYMAWSQTPLDLLALITLWIVVVPPGDFGKDESTALSIRLALSAVYAVDITIRSALAKRHLRYVRTHPLSLVVVPFPPLRVVFSLRLVRSVFRRGHLSRFLLAASLLVVNGAIAVYFYERHAPGSNIHTLGESLWWSMVTVTTVGYGDYYPVTTLGRVAAGFIMGTGILTLAVVTAQVSSSFVEQAARRREGPGDPALPREEVSREQVSREQVSLADLAERLARIEQLLAGDPRTQSGAPEEPARQDRD
jgi:voltage-gated potassium channel